MSLRPISALLCMSVLAACDGGKAFDPLSVPGRKLEATRFYALTNADTLITFDKRAPDRVLSSVPIIGATATDLAGETLMDLTARPSDGTLYLLTRKATTGTLYTVAPATGVATKICVLANPTTAAPSTPSAPSNPTPPTTVPAACMTVPPTQASIQACVAAGGVPAAPTAPGGASPGAAIALDPNADVNIVFDPRNTANIRVLTSAGQNLVASVTAAALAAPGAAATCDTTVHTTLRTGAAATPRQMRAFAYTNTLIAGTVSTTASTLGQLTNGQQLTTLLALDTTSLAFVGGDPLNGAITVACPATRDTINPNCGETTNYFTLNDGDKTAPKPVTLGGQIAMIADGITGSTLVAAQPAGTTTTPATPSSSNLSQASTLYEFTDNDGLAPLGVIGDGKLAIKSLAAIGPAKTAVLYGIQNTSTLVSFSPAAPGTFTSSRTISGLSAGEKILDLDFRPSNATMYALTNFGRIYAIVEATAAAIGPVSVASGVLSDTDTFGSDFNPTADRLRVTSFNTVNARTDVDSGGVALDQTLSQAGIFALAYANSYEKASQTILFGLDSPGKRLVRIGGAPATTDDTDNNPNKGVVTPLGDLKVFTTGTPPPGLTRVGGFDIAGGDNGLVFASLEPSGSGSSSTPVATPLTPAAAEAPSGLYRIYLADTVTAATTTTTTVTRGTASGVTTSPTIGGSSAAPVRALTIVLK